MKPPVFKYHDPGTLEEALALLASLGDDARVLAGGQSLMPLLNFRLARPAHLVDINRIAELGGVSRGAHGVSLGAMVRQRELERSSLLAEACPLIGQAMPLVGHPQIRNRGTLGGSLAHADPAAELPAVVLAADARIVARSAQGERAIGAEDFFQGQLTTALRADELIVRIEAPSLPKRTGTSVQEVAMRVGDFALAGVVTTLTVGPTRLVTRARIVCFGVGDRPMRIRNAEVSLEGQVAGEESFAAAGHMVSAALQGEVVADMHASAAYRQRVCGVLAKRALGSAWKAIV